MANTSSKRPFEILHRLSRSISQAQNLEEIYELILKEIVAVMDVERASIMRYDPKESVLRIVAAKGIEPEVWKNIEMSVGEGVSGRVWQEGKPLLIKKMEPSPRYKTHSYMITPVTAFPMKVGAVPIGLINLTDKKSGKPFTNSDLKFLMIISDQVASYMHIYDLVERVKSGEAAKLQLELAREIQQRLLPKAAPKMRGLEMEGCLIPAERVGADYYDYYGPWTMDHGPSTLGICIADVSGHNVGGALLAFAMRASLKTEAANGNSPSQIVERVNKILFNDLFQSEQFISLFYAQYLNDSKKFIYTNAGHNPPLLLRASDKSVEWLFTQDSLLGIEPKISFKEKECRLESGDVVVLYTDGLTEAQGSKKNNFGTEGLVTTLKECHKQSAKAILASLMESWQKFIGKQPPKDDVTVVVLKVSDT